MTEIHVFSAEGSLIKSINKVLSASLRDSLDGECTFEFSVLANSALLFEVDNFIELLVENIAYHFKIVRLAKSILNSLSICTITCEHRSYELNDERFNLEAFDFTGLPKTGLERLLAGTSFVSGAVDFTESMTLKINQKCSRRAALMQFIAVLGGEIFYDGNTIGIKRHRGELQFQEVMGGKKVSDLSVVLDSRSATSTYGLKLYKKLDFGVGDNVHIVFSPFDLNVKTRIIAMSYNPFNRMEIVVDVGDYVPKIADNLYRLEKEVEKTKEKVNNLSDATAAVKIATNIKDIVISSTTEELFSLAYSALKSTYAVFVTTVKFNVSSEDEFTFQLLFNNDTVMEYTERFNVGLHTKTFSYPFPSMLGMTNIRLRAKSDGLAICPKMQSWGYVMGAYLAQETPWDGTIYHEELIPLHKIMYQHLRVVELESSCLVDFVSKEGSVIYDEIAKQSLIKTFSAPQKCKALSEIPMGVMSAFFIDLTHIGIRFQNPIYFDGGRMLESFTVAGGVSGSLVPVEIISAEAINDTVILKSTGFQVFDSDFLVGYSNGSLKSVFSEEIIPSFSLPFSKSTSALSVSKIRSSSEIDATNVAQNLINTANMSFWSPTDADNLPTVFVSFNKFTRLESYSLRSRHDNITGSPKSWVVEVLQESGWTVIDTKENQQWQASEERQFPLTHGSYFQILRLRVTQSNSASYRGFSKLKFKEK